LLVLTGCGQRPTQAHSSEWDAYVNNYLGAYFFTHPDVAVVLGRHDFDGKLRDFSPQALSGEIARLHAARQHAANFRDDALDSKQRFERDYLIAAVEGDLFWLESAKEPYRNPQFYSDPIDPEVYLTRPYAPLEQRMRAFITYAHAFPRALDQMRANLRPPLPRTYVDRGHALADGLAQYFSHDVPGIFASVSDAQLQSSLHAAVGDSVRGLRALDAWFQSQQPQAVEDGYALGPEKFRKMLRDTERVEIPLERIESIGREDLKNNLAALRDACSRYAPGRSLTECVAKMNSDKPNVTPVEAAKRQVAELRTFVLTTALVRVPGTEEAMVDDAPPYQRWNFAYINIPGPYEKNMPSVYYISPPDPKWSRAEQVAYLPGKAALLFTTAHEVMPGHFLQYLHTNRSASKVGRIFGSYAFVEGWAHYAEELVWEAGLGSNDPGIHVGQLSEALLRDVRFLSAIGLHTEHMSVEQSERMFRESAFQDSGNARQQAARGTFDPAYLNYTLGKLMIRKLRDDWTASRGRRNAWRQFHDQFLEYGAPPIPLVRAAMLGGLAGPPL
jgi:uncharacterized protein (DUF885 family)